jgi:molecular chaperone Hsp33
VEQMLDQFSEQDLKDMADNGVITVTCEFCNTHYRFTMSDYLKSGEAEGGDARPAGGDKKN